MSDPEARLQHFRATHPLTRRSFAGVPWTYIACGDGQETLLLLPGAPGIAEMAFAYILAFEQHYRVLAPSYPASVGTLDHLIAGLTALVHAEGAEPVHLIGASYSGMVAQYLLRYYPDLIATLLIGDTGIPRIERAWASEIMLALLVRLPRLGLHAFLYPALRGVLKGNTAIHRFWQRYFKALVSSLTVPEFANRVRVMIDMDRRERLIGPPLFWYGPTLLMETADDPLFSPAERAALRARYPNATIHTFYNESHITALTRADEYIVLMLDFLAHQSSRQ